MGRSNAINSVRRTRDHAAIAIVSLERRIKELERVANAQSRELRIQFERIAQLQAGWDILRIRSAKS